MVMNEMTFNLNLFGLILKDIIMSNLNSTINQRANTNRDALVLEKRVQPNEFNNGVNQSTIFNHNSLLLNCKEIKASRL